MKKIACLLVLASAAFTLVSPPLIKGAPLQRHSQGHPPPGPLRDVSNADILGIQLRMNSGEVIKILQERFHAKTGADLTVDSTPGFYDKRSSYVSYIRYRSPQLLLQIRFAESYPGAPGKREFVTMINYEQQYPQGANGALQERYWQELLDAAIQKYGPPTLLEGIKGQNLWCPVVGSAGVTCDGQDPTLSVLYNAIILTDRGYEARRVRQEYNNAQQVTRPVL